MTVDIEILQIKINRYQIMESENPQDQLRKKLSESITRSAELLTTAKVYQFTQKIKMLALRKTQTNKHQEAQILLELGIKKMLSQPEVELNATHDLINALIELYENNKTLWTNEKANQIYTMLTEKENERNAEYFLRIIKNLSSIKDSPEMTEYIISFYQKQALFHKAENIVARMDISRTMQFLQKWHDKVDNDQYCIIVCRMALIKGYHGENFDQSMVLLSELDTLNSFVKFVKFLILSVQMKSKESYSRIGSSYKTFLKADNFFAEIYQKYGAKFFNKEKEGSGLLNLFQK